MKPLKIDFVAPTAWRPIWACTALIATVALGSFAWKAKEFMTAIQAVVIDIATTQSETEKLRKQAANKLVPRTSSASKAVTLLQFDMNKVFSVMENVDVPGTRLAGVTLDMTSGNLGVEYVLEQSIQAQAITDALNSGYDTRPWRLSRVGSNTSSSSSSVLSESSTSQLKQNSNGFWQINSARL